MLLHDGPGAFLDAHRGDDVRRRADELDPRNPAHFCEAGVLAQKSVAGVDSIYVGDLGRADDGGNVEVAAGALGRPDAYGLVGEPNRQTVAVGFGIYRDGRNAEILASRR